jgi:hypothetical protein
MTHETVPPSDSPYELLTSVRDLTRQVRIAQRATWFPLLVFAVTTLAAIPVDRYGPHHLACRATHEPGGAAGRVCMVVRPWSLAYWPTALVLAYAAIAGFYLYQSRRRGVGTRIRPYVVVGVVIAGLLAAASLWLAHHALLPGPLIFGLAPRTLWASQLATPAVAIGLALLVLAWVERNRALTWFGLGYLVVVLAPTMWLTRVHHPGPWGFLPRLLTTAAVLLLGSLGFAVNWLTTQRRPR